MKKLIPATIAISFFIATNAQAQKSDADYFLGNAKYSNYHGFLLYGYQNELANKVLFTRYWRIAT